MKSYSTVGFGHFCSISKTALSLFMVIILSTVAFGGVAQGPGIPIYIGPFTDKNNDQVNEIKIYVSYGSETRNWTTGVNGTARVVVPSSWLNKTVTVKAEKPGYKTKTFTGSIDASGKFTPSGGAYPKLEKETQVPAADNQFLIVALIVLIVLCLVLVGMKDTSKTKYAKMDEDEEASAKSDKRKPKKDKGKEEE